VTEDGTVRLPDGRILGYAEWGDAGEVAVMLFHGTPGYRLYWKSLPGFPFLQGVRLIAPDRPGYGLSTFRRGLTYADWPDDVLYLADALGLGRFAVVGGSGSGPHALACAWKIAGRLTHVAVVSSVGPPVPEILGAISRANRIAYGVARHAPWLMRINLRFLAGLQRRDPDAFLDRMAFKLPPADRDALRRPAVRHALHAAMSAEAVPPGAPGYAQDVIDQSRPWPFPLAEIPITVHVWQSEYDTSAPPAVAAYLERLIPDCRLHLVPGAGHFWHAEHATEVLDHLLRSI
jgi:pimeloyl-ACP methyl ester carboxylesterase